MSIDDGRHAWSGNRRSGTFSAKADLTNQIRSGLIGSMIIRNISEAKAELSALIEAVSKGEEVLIGKAGVPVARLVRYTGAVAPRVPGDLEGQIKMAEDFDQLPSDIAEAFGIDP